MPKPSGSLPRIMAELSLGSNRRMRQRERRDLDMGFSEVVQQYQINIEGEPGGAFGFASVDVSFAYPFYYAPAQRDSDLDVPHMTFGGEASTDLAMSAVVTSWDRDADNDAINGATVCVGVLGASETYTGVVHLSFQGFAALGEDETAING